MPSPARRPPPSAPTASTSAASSTGSTAPPTPASRSSRGHPDRGATPEYRAVVAQGGALHVHQLKITLRDTEVWRRLQVPSAITLSNLHDAIQAAMGWENRHLHDFE